MAKNPLDRIQSYYEDLTKTDLEIAIYFINNPHDVATTPSDMLAKKIGTSKAAISRFCQHVGYTGYLEFRYEMARFLASRNAESSNAEADPVIAITQAYSEYILKMKDSFTTEDLHEIALMYLKARRVKIFGVNRSYNSALQFRQRLSKLKYDAEACGDNGTITEIVNTMTSEDLVFIFTTTDNQRTYTPHVKTLHDAKCPFIVITMNPNLPFKKQAAKYIALPRISKEASISFLDDQPLFLIFIEMLISAIAKESDVYE